MEGGGLRRGDFVEGDVPVRRGRLLVNAHARDDRRRQAHLPRGQGPVGDRSAPLEAPGDQVSSDMPYREKVGRQGGPPELLVRGLDDDLPPFAHAGAVGNDPAVRRQGDMHDAALVGRHRFECEGPTCSDHVVGDPTGHVG